MRELTDQEIFWTGNFGDQYISRNRSAELLASNVAFFSEIVRCVPQIGSVIEFGANVGMNLLALRHLLPNAKFTALEINKAAFQELEKLDGVKAINKSIYDFMAEEPYDLVFTKGVLIHLDPEMLPKAYEILHSSTARYLCIAEYYNPAPVEIPYRGHSGKLFKRDFAGELLQKYSDLRLRSYGFAYRNDPNFPQDDLTWFLMERCDT